MKRREVMALEYPQNLYTLILMFEDGSYYKYKGPFPKGLIPQDVDRRLEDIVNLYNERFKRKFEVFLKYMKGQSVRDIAKEYNVSISAIRSKINDTERVLSCNKNKFILEHGLAAYEAKKASDDAAKKAAEEKAKKEFEERLFNPDTRLDTIAEISIHNAGFGIRATNALNRAYHRNGMFIDNIGHIIKYPPSKILGIYSIGTAVFDDILTNLEERFGIKVDTEKDEWII